MHLRQILAVIEQAAVAARVKSRAAAVYQALAAAEARAHGTTADKVHFHEVGAADAIIDVMACCLGLELLDITTASSEPPVLGHGTVRCAHGEMPVPVPAVVELLLGRDVRSGDREGEWTTPTGAALLAALTAPGAFSGRLSARGYGAGQRDPSGHANVLAVEVLAPVADAAPSEIALVECNLDDLPGERLTMILPQLLTAGALDVTVVPCLMKKGRQGMVLQALCPPATRAAVVDCMLRQTTTFGVRWYPASRRVLSREFCQVETAYGRICVKLGILPETGEVLRLAPEFESCRAAAVSHDCDFAKVYDAAVAAARADLDSRKQSPADQELK